MALIAASCTRSAVSSAPRATAGSRPWAQRASGGRHRWRMASIAEESPLLARMMSSMVGSSLKSAVVSSVGSWVMQRR